MKIRIEHLLYFLYALCTILFLSLILYVNVNGIIFNYYDPAKYKSFVNGQHIKENQPLLYHILTKSYLCIIATFILILINISRKVKENIQDRICITVVLSLFIISFYAHDFMPIMDGKKLAKSFMDGTATGQTHDKSCWGARWTAFLKVKSPHFDEIIVHNNPTYLRAVVGLKNDRIVTYFLYAEKWDRYKIHDVDLFENKYPNETKMWQDFSKKLTESELRTYCWLEKTLSDNFSNIKSNEPLFIYHDVFQQMYDDLVKVLDIVEPNVHHPSSTELTRESLRQSSH